MLNETDSDSVLVVVLLPLIKVEYKEVSNTILEVVCVDSTLETRVVVSTAVVEFTNIPLPEEVKAVVTSDTISVEDELNKLLVDDNIPVIDSVVTPTLEVCNVDEMVNLDFSELLDEVEAD